MATKNPLVKILEEAKSRKINTKSGEKTVWYQPVQVECEQFRVRVDMDIDSQDVAHRVGTQYEWDVIADLVPGAFSSIDIARRMTLVPMQAAAKAA